MTSNSTVEQVLKRLDIIVLLLLENVRDETPSISEKIDKLHGLGLTTGEISGIVGKPANYVSAVTRRKKKGKS